jgi:hypothetical protein
MSPLSAVATVDIRENRLSSLSAAISGLASLPALCHLRVDLKGGDTDLAMLTAELQSLETINGAPVVRQGQGGGTSSAGGAGAAASSTAAAATAAAAEHRAVPARQQPPPRPAYSHAQAKAQAAAAAEEDQEEEAHASVPSAGDISAPPAGETAAATSARSAAEGVAAAAASATATTAAAVAPAAPSLPEVSMTEAALESVALLYGSLKALRGRVSREEDAALTGLFDGHVQAVMHGLAARLERTSDAHVRQSAILAAKWDLYDVCGSLAVELAAGHKPEFG